jgi:hypothetical protein
MAGTPPCTVSGICSEGLGECLTTACPSGPQGGCGTSLKSLLLIKNKTPDSKDKLTWKFIKGPATTQTQLGDPTTTADYALCVYAGSANALVAQINVPPSNTKWKTLGTKGYKFLDNTLADDGAQKILVKGGAAGKSKMLVKGKGVNLPDPVLPLDFPVTVQLFNYQTGVCFDSSFSALSAKKNVPTLFKAKNP